MKSFYFAKRKLQLVRVATILVALAISIPVSAQSITTFDAPGAGTGPFPEGTFPYSPLIINPNGAITGWYTDSAQVSHGFLRDRNGAFTTFDAPGAPGAGPGTFPFAISPGGEITGFYDNGINANHGFLRDKKGVVTTYDVPGAGTGLGQGTFGGGFTPNGNIMGNYTDADNVSHGFLMDRNGVFTTLDAPSACTG